LDGEIFLEKQARTAALFLPPKRGLENIKSSH
jgi:hypothetical protein